MEVPEVTDRAVCSVCYDGLSEGNHGGVISTPCGHLFHQDCIIQSFKSDPVMAPLWNSMVAEGIHEAVIRVSLKGSCPVCRSPTTYSSCRNIYLSLNADEKEKVANYVKGTNDVIAGLQKREGTYKKIIRDYERNIQDPRNANKALGKSSQTTRKMPAANTDADEPRRQPRALSFHMRLRSDRHPKSDAGTTKRAQ